MQPAAGAWAWMKSCRLLRLPRSRLTSCSAHPRESACCSEAGLGNSVAARQQLPCLLAKEPESHEDAQAGPAAGEGRWASGCLYALAQGTQRLAGDQLGEPRVNLVLHLGPGF